VSIEPQADIAFSTKRITGLLMIMKVANCSANHSGHVVTPAIARTAMFSWRVWCKNTYSERLADKLPLPPMATGAGMVTDRSGPCAASLGALAILL